MSPHIFCVAEPYRLPAGWCGREHRVIDQEAYNMEVRKFWKMMIAVVVVVYCGGWLQHV